MKGLILSAITRRRFAFLSAALAVTPAAARAAPRDSQPKAEFAGLTDEFDRIERESGGRLGVAVLDTGSGAQATHRGDERFPMCSTFKLLAAAAILTQVDAGRERLERMISYGPQDIVEYSPTTSPRVSEGRMSLAELCEAAITLSDNTAGNLLLANIGGPAGLTAFARSIGDKITRLDRIEPGLNEALPEDPRDTTSPEAMLADIKLLVLGERLTQPSRHQLTEWLLGNKTGGPRLRAGLGPTWRVADKTGTGERGTTNDVGVIWPPNRAPLLVCVYLTGSPGNGDQRNATIAAVGQAIRGATRV
jgi:beta-lactamase class A